MIIGNYESFVGFKNYSIISSEDFFYFSPQQNYSYSTLLNTLSSIKEACLDPPLLFLL